VLALSFSPVGRV